MSPWLRRLALAVLAGSVLLVAASVTPDEPFSRSRWLQKHKGSFLSSRGLLPTTEPLPAALLRAPALVPELPAKAKPTWTRVSRDILAPDRGPGQPETQAEPYLAIDPEKETRQGSAWV